MTDHRTPSPRPARRSGPQVLSTLLFVAAIGFAAAAVYIWFMDDSNESNEPPVAPVEAGRYELVNVLNALEDAGLEADFGRSPATAGTDQMDAPGQNLQVEDTNVFIFIFSGADAETAAAAREAAFARLDPATMTLTTPSGNDVANGQPLAAWEGANVIAVLIGGDAELQAQVQDVIEGLS